MYRSLILLRRPAATSLFRPLEKDLGGMVRTCSACGTQRAAVKRPKTGAAVCKQCFYLQFETEIHETITSHALFKPGERVAIGASGGKDSTVLAYVLSLLNKRHDYGLDLFLLSVDEGITGYRDDSLEAVQRNKVEYGLPLLIVDYRTLYGWTMDEIVEVIGTKSNCTFCGVFRRQALDRGAVQLKAEKVATGHNADDIAETVLLNFLRGDFPRLSRCVDAVTGRDSALPRVKPFKYTYEKEIVMYAYFKKLHYFATECIYSPNAYRGHARQFLKDLEAIRPSAILDVICSAEQFTFPPPGSKDTAMPVQKKCERCGYITSQTLCKACVLTDSLNNGTAADVNRRSQKVKAVVPCATEVANAVVAEKKSANDANDSAPN